MISFEALLALVFYLVMSLQVSVAGLGRTNQELVIIVTLNSKFFVFLACHFINYIICSSFI